MLGTLMRRLFRRGRLQINLHQSPMWIKAVIGPWHLVMPQKMIGNVPDPK